MPQRRDSILVCLIAAALSISAFLHYFDRGQILFYGDAVAHINIARRVFDSLTPGPLQLGTVWLPLPHLLSAPLLANQWMWQSGAGGSIVSMLAYLLAVLGIFRLVRGRDASSARRLAAWIAAFIFALNPNLLYMQSTAMTESLYLATSIWPLVFLQDFAHFSFAAPAWPRARNSLLQCCAVLFLAGMTRYDGWFLTAAVGLVVLAMAWRARKSFHPGRLTAAATACLLIAVAAPALWIGYNWYVFKNPSEFLTGPYSARAIAARTTKQGDPPHPGHHAPKRALDYYAKVSQLTLGDERWGYAFLWLTLAGTAIAVRRWRSEGVWLLLWTAVPTYVLSIAYGGLPIFIPMWWPHGYYNVRYGLQMLPVFAVFTGVLVATLYVSASSRRTRSLILTVGLLFVVRSYAAVLHDGPITLREAENNSTDRREFHRRYADLLRGVPQDARILTYLGTHAGAFQRAGIPLRNVINEGNYTLWRDALNDPAASADYIIAFDDDPVGAAVRSHPHGLELITRLQPHGYAAGAIYHSTIRTAPPTPER